VASGRRLSIVAGNGCTKSTAPLRRRSVSGTWLHDQTSRESIRLRAYELNRGADMLKRSPIYVFRVDASEGARQGRRRSLQ